MDRHAVEVIVSLGSSLTFKVFVLYPSILQVLNHESFLGISEVALKQIISRDSFCAAEVSVKQC